MNPGMPHPQGRLRQTLLGMQSQLGPANAQAFQAGQPISQGPGGTDLGAQNAQAWQQGGYQQYNAQHPEPTPMDFRGRMPGRVLPKVRPLGQ